MNVWVLSEFEAKNHLYLEKIKKEGKAVIAEFSQDILDQLQEISLDVLEDMKTDAKASEILDSYFNFKKKISDWHQISEKRFYASLR